MKKKLVSQSEQPRRFRDAARELGCDESEERFDAALKKVASASATEASQKPIARKSKRGLSSRSED